MRFFFQKEEPRDNRLASLVRQIHELEFDKSWLVTIKEIKPTRSLQQNAYLWGVCYTIFLEESGLKEQGWTNEDLHDYFLGEHFGWEEKHLLETKIVRPIKRSSKLSITEFADYLDFVIRKAAEHGIVIPDAT